MIYNILYYNKYILTKYMIYNILYYNKYKLN